MKKNLVLMCMALLLSVTIVNAQQKKVIKKGTPKTITSKTNIDSFGYAMGFNQGNYFGKEPMLAFNFESFKQGYFDAINHRRIFADSIINQIIQTKFEARQKAQNEFIAKQGKEFFANLKKNTNVKTLIDNNVFYEVLKAVDSGKSPLDTNKVKVYYSGSLPDGKVFDENIKAEEPAEFPVNGVVRGFSEALKKMKAGETWKVYISSEYGYGQQGAGSTIPPNSPLIFIINLVSITP